MYESLKKAFTNLFKEVQTIDYPLTPIVKDKEYRGLIEYGEESCIYCLKCEKACPSGAILFVKTDNPAQNEKNKKSLKYNYNPYLCIYCSECVRACPKADEALWQSNKKPEPGEDNNINSDWSEIETQYKNR